MNAFWVSRVINLRIYDMYLYVIVSGYLHMSLYGVCKLMYIEYFVSLKKEKVNYSTDLPFSLSSSFSC